MHEVIFIDGPLGSLLTISYYHYLMSYTGLFMFVFAGLKLKETKSCGGAVIITGFSRMPDGGYLQAELVVCVFCCLCCGCD